MWKNKRQIDDYTEEELRRILCERFRVARQERLREFQRSGKARFSGPLLSLNRPNHTKLGRQARIERSRFSTLLKVLVIVVG